MKFLILGCNGMAGHMISIYLKEKGHNVTGFARKKSIFVPTVIGDVRNTELLKNIIFNGKYDIIVNCVGILTENAEKFKAEAVYINSFIPHFLAEVTQESETQIIQMSTDCVFSGKEGGYFVNALKDGTSFYGRTKAIGELEDAKNVTIRSSIVGPDTNPSGMGLFNWFMMQSGTIYGYTKVLWSGQTTLQYAKTIEEIAGNHVYGVYNLVPEKSISKKELLDLFNQYMRNNIILIKPQSNIVSDRSLKRTKFDYDFSIPDYERMVSELAIWINEHKRIYPHYNL